MSSSAIDDDEERETGRAREEGRLLDDARSVALDAVVELLADVHRVKQLRREAGERRRRGARGEDEPRVVVDGGATLGDLLFDFARLQLGMVEQVLQFQRRHREVLFSRVQRAVFGGGDPHTPATGVAPLAVEDESPLILAGSPGGTASGRLVVDNRGSRRVHVSVRLSELRSRDGEPPFFAGVTLSPDQPFELEPDEEREVSLQVALDARFRAGRRYRGDVEITMAGRPRQRVPVRVDVARDDSPDRAR